MSAITIIKSLIILGIIIVVVKCFCEKEEEGVPLWIG